MATDSATITAEFLGSERRSEQRGASVYRPAIIETDSFAGFCLVRNLSNGGLQGLIYAHLAEGEAINVQFPTGLDVAGHVVWAKDQMIGVQFDAPVDMEQLLKDLATAKTGNKVNRAPRVNIEWVGTVTAEGVRQSVVVHDISQKGQE